MSTQASLGLDGPAPAPLTEERRAAYDVDRTPLAVPRQVYAELAPELGTVRRLAACPRAPPRPITPRSGAACGATPHPTEDTTMPKSIHTMPAKIRRAVRSPDAMCTCGAPASQHIDHFGLCFATNCERWSWDPAPPKKRAKEARLYL